MPSEHQEQLLSSAEKIERGGRGWVLRGSAGLRWHFLWGLLVTHDQHESRWIGRKICENLDIIFYLPKIHPNSRCRDFTAHFPDRWGVLPVFYGVSANIGDAYFLCWRSHWLKGPNLFACWKNNLFSPILGYHEPGLVCLLQTLGVPMNTLQALADPNVARKHPDMAMWNVKAIGHPHVTISCNFYWDTIWNGCWTYLRFPEGTAQKSCHAWVVKVGTHTHRRTWVKMFGEDATLNHSEHLTPLRHIMAYLIKHSNQTFPTQGERCNSAHAGGSQAPEENMSGSSMSSILLEYETTHENLDWSRGLGTIQGETHHFKPCQRPMGSGIGSIAM